MPEPTRNELDRLLRRNDALLTQAILEVGQEQISAATPGPVGRNSATMRLAVLLAHLGAMADLLGRRRIVLQRRAVPVSQAIPGRFPGRALAEGDSPLTPSEDFDRVVQDLLSRTPELAPGWQRVQEVYARHGFALAKSAQQVITERVQKALVDARRRQKIPGPLQTQDLIREIEPWSASYAENVQRTNLTGSYAAGQIKEVEEDESGLLAGWQVQTAGDVDVRSNHSAFDGFFIARGDSAMLTAASPPYGYNCRCGLLAVDIITAERNQWVDAQGRPVSSRLPPGARRDPKFRGGRPDRSIYSGA